MSRAGISATLPARLEAELEGERTKFTPELWFEHLYNQALSNLQSLGLSPDKALADLTEYLGPKPETHVLERIVYLQRLVSASGQTEAFKQRLAQDPSTT